MQRLIGKFCIIKYLGEINIYENLEYVDYIFYARKVKKHKLTVTISYDEEFDFFRVIIED